MALKNIDILKFVQSFLCKDYVSMAPVCQDWEIAWGNNPTVTFPLVSSTTPEMLKYAFDTGMDKNESITEKCAFLGRLDLIKVCRDFGCPWGVSVSNAASNSTELVKWLVENGCPMDYTICSGAASLGLMDVLVSAIDRGFGVDSYTFSAAAKKGNIHIMEFLLSIKCPWISYTSECAALNGQLEALKWLMENGCPFESPSLFRAARKNGNFEIVKYLEGEKFLEPILPGQ